MTKEGEELVGGSKFRSVARGCIGMGLEDFLEVMIVFGEQGGVVFGSG